MRRLDEIQLYWDVKKFKKPLFNSGEKLTDNDESNNIIQLI